MRKKELTFLYILTFVLVLGILWGDFLKFSRQIEEYSVQQLNMAFELILDDVRKRADELSTKLELFVRSSLAGPIYLTELIQEEIEQQGLQGTFREVRKLMPYLSPVAHEIRKIGHEIAADKIFVYNSKRELLAVYYETSAGSVAGVHLSSIAKQSFIPVEPNEDWLLNLQSLREIPQQALPQSISPIYHGAFPETIQVELARFDGRIGLRVLVPILGRRKLEGLGIFYRAITQQDIERYSRLSQTRINLFVGPHLSAGTLPTYTQPVEKHVQTIQAFDLKKLSAPLQINKSKVTHSGEHYYQGLISLKNRHDSFGKIAVLFPRSLERHRQGEFAILVVVIILVFGFLYKDIRRAEKIEDLNLELKTRAVELEQTNKQLTDEIRERKKMERELHAAKNTAEAANQAKSRFLANMSHELRTPLNAILGYAQILQEPSGLNELQKRGLSTIYQSGEHLLTLITEVLDLAKIEAGRMELQDEPSFLAELLDSLAEMIRIRAQRNRLRFTYEYDTSLPKSVFVDSKRLQEVLLNLLGNAFKMTKNGSVAFRVTRITEQELVPEPVDSTKEQLLKRREESVTILFEIEDTGPGIPEEQLQNIFAPFHQLSEHRTSESGTGLGLTISRRFVEMMGGEIRVRSTVGKGSCFFFVLTLREAPHAQQLLESPQKKIIGYTGARRRLLIVDDITENRAILRDILGTFDFQIMEAEDGRDGLRIAVEASPDLILSDLVMPEMDGFELARRIRRTEAIHQTPLIAVSANAFDDVRTRCLEAGFDDFITKPFRMKDVLRVLERYLHLEWIYESSHPGVQEKPEADAKLLQTLDLLPNDRRLALLEQVNRGDVKGILKELELIEQLGSQFHPFTKELRSLARRFQINQLIERLSENN